MKKHLDTFVNNAFDLITMLFSFIRHKSAVGIQQYHFL